MAKTAHLSSPLPLICGRVAIIAYGKGTMPPHRGMLDMPTIRGIAVYIEKFRN